MSEPLPLSLSDSDPLPLSLELESPFLPLLTFKSGVPFQVIARKWRPQKFSDLIGQEVISRTLCNSIEYSRIHHAYLFCGTRGVGKTTTARLLSKALNCHRSEGPTITPCVPDSALCISCAQISEGESIDVMEIDAASNTGVDNVRENILDSSSFQPSRDRYKVFIIDEVHALSAAAFNALLKTLEEPPAYIIFIMATTEVQKVPDTIASRCQVFNFKSIPDNRIVERLRYIAGEEGILIPDEALREIARAGEGSMRDAQSAFDQVLNFAGNEVKLDDVERALGITQAETLGKIIYGIAENKPVVALEMVDYMISTGHDLRGFCRDLLGHFRNLLVCRMGGEGDSEMMEQAALFSESDLTRFFHSFSYVEDKLKTASNPRYQVEIGLVKLMEMRKLTPLNELMIRFRQIEKRLQ